MDGSFHKHDSAAEIVERITEQGRNWADKEAAASWLEESRKSVRAQIAVKHLQDVSSVAKAELLAEASQEYIDHIKSMVNARKSANIARVNYDGGRTWSDLIRTQEASKRAEMQLR